MAAALTPRDTSSVKEGEIREFLFSHLADYKVPSQIVIVDKIPKGPTGKLQRIGMAEKLASLSRSEYVSPRNEVEKMLAKIWEESLNIQRVGIHDNFFALGGDSLLATRVFSRVRMAFQIELPLRAVFRDPTILGQALRIEEAVLADIEELSDEEARGLTEENIAHDVQSRKRQAEKPISRDTCIE